MKKIIVFSFLILIASCKKHTYQSVESIKNTQLLFLSNFKSLQIEIDKLQKLATKNSTQDALKEQFEKTRIAFKPCEEFIAFYFPTSFTKINGAPIDENEENEANRKTEEATGFQKIEECLYDTAFTPAQLAKETAILQAYIHTLLPQVETLQLSDSNIFEVQKLQLIRIMSLGISGFDSSIALQSLPETKSALQGIQSYVNCFDFDKSLNKKISSAIQFISTNYDFNTFDRATFITQKIIPIYTQINQIQKKLKIKNNTIIGAVDFSKNSPFEKGSFNVNYFAPAYNRNPTSAQVSLGKELFFDKILSGDNTVSCAQCHNPNQAYADHKSVAIANSTNPRNTPTLLHVALQNSQFVDGRVKYLEDQAKAVINNKDEMHGNFKTALKNINKNPIYLKKFKEVFPNQNEITEENLLKSIASFVRTLSPINSKFDKYLRGEALLNQNEKNGFNVFMGKAKCATCHFFPLFNGSVPPLYNKTESEVLGVPSNSNTRKIDSDLGEYNITLAPLKKHAFKTPTIRNSALTFPYMHHGSFNTLEEVIKFYNKGGGKGLGLVVENQTLPEQQLNLSKQEINDLISFIKTLNDEY